MKSRTFCTTREDTFRGGPKWSGGGCAYAQLGAGMASAIVAAIIAPTDAVLKNLLAAWSPRDMDGTSHPSPPRRIIEPTHSTIRRPIGKNPDR